MRQERELNKIQRQEDELPQIMHRHTEEVKAARKQLRRSQEEVVAGKQKAEELLKEIRRLSEYNRKLEKLVKSRKLMERDQLTVQLDQMRQRLQEKEKRVTVSWERGERGREAMSSQCAVFLLASLGVGARAGGNLQKPFARDEGSDAEEQVIGHRDTVTQGDHSQVSAAAEGQDLNTYLSTLMHTFTVSSSPLFLPPLTSSAHFPLARYFPIIVSSFPLL